MNKHSACFVVFLTLIIPPAVHAGFLDNLVKKTKETVQKSVEQTVEETVDEKVDKVLSPEDNGNSDPAQVEHTPEPDKPEDPKTAEESKLTEPAAEEYPTTELAIAKAVVSIAPEIFELRPEYDVKNLLLVFFPEEKEIKTNKFYWYKNKDALIEKAIALSKDAPTSFEVAPWINNADREPQPGQIVEDRDLELMFGEYDFEKKAIPVYKKLIPVPWFSGGGKYGPAMYRIVGAKPLPDVTWIDMPIDEAEQFYANAAYRSLLTSYRYSIKRVVGLDNIEEHPDYDKYAEYIEKGGKTADGIKQKMYPVFDVVIENNTIDLYMPKEKDFKMGGVKPKSDLKQIATLRLEAE